MSIDKEKILGIAHRYVLKGQSKKAVKELEKLVETSPDDSRLRLKLGDLYLRNGDSDGAIKEYLKVADLYTAEDLSLKAISIYKKVLSINPNYIEALREMASLYAKEGLEGSAKGCYQTILKIKPDDREALAALEKIDHPAQPGEPQEQDLRGIPEHAIQPPPRPGPPQVKGETSSKVSLGSRPPPPAQDGKELSFDKDAEMHYHLGIAYKEMELFDYAITEFELASQDPMIQFDCGIMLGACYMERGDYDKAIEYFKKALEIKEIPPEKLAHLHYNLGLAYEANGMLSDALDTFRQVLKLDGSNSDAQERIEKLQPTQK